MMGRLDDLDLERIAEIERLSDERAEIYHFIQVGQEREQMDYYLGRLAEIDRHLERLGADLCG
ncbi:MAG: hypothetical protein PHZ19_09995 [Candidatus Thermoplasmatota archaeon]|nr:hypothetical protein [Candidatus Thermoplasmatota archaeon]